MLTRVLSILCVSACFCGLVHAQTTTLSGRAFGSDGKPVAGATVYLVTYQGRGAEPVVKHAETATDGAFAFRELQPGSSGELIALKKGHGAARVALAKDKVTDVQIILKAPGNIAGDVHDKAGKPIADVKVRVTAVQEQREPWRGAHWPVLEQLAILSATTDASGKFRIGSLPEGWLVSLDVNHPGFARWHESGIKVGRQDLKFVLVPSARITGRVVFEGTGQTAAGLRIECQQDSLSSGARFIAHARGTTDDKGCFLLDNLLPGNYSVFPVHYHEDDPEWAGLPKRAENLAEGGLVNCGDLVLTRGGFVAGKVTDRDTGKPLAGVSIMARLAHYSTFVEPRRANTKPDGTYKLRLAPAEWRIHVTGREGFISPWDERNTSRDVRVAPGQTTEGVDFTLGRGAELRGIVVDPRGRPVSKAIVRLGAIWSRATTKDDGTFSLHGLKPDQEVSLCAHSPDHALGAIVAVTPNRDHAEPIIIKLAPCVKMTGTVVDGNGKPIQEARVRVQQHISRPSSARWIMEIDSAQTDGQGRFALRLLPGTEHNLEVHAEGYGQARMPKLTVNREKDVGKLVLRKADAFIAGRVTDVEGNPILGAQVNAYGDGQPLLCRGITDSQGRYRIEPLVQGKVRVSVWCGNDSAHREDVPTGSQDVDLVLARREEPKAVLHAGQDGPEITVAQWLSGQGVKGLKELTGKVVLLQFAAPYNPAVEPCNEKLKELHQKYAQDGLVIVSIYDASLPANETAEYVKSKGIPWVVGQVAETPQMGWSSPAFKAYGVRSVPSVFVIDRSGKLGLINPALAELEAGIQKLLVER